MCAFGGAAGRSYDKTRQQRRALNSSKINNLQQAAIKSAKREAETDWHELGEGCNFNDVPRSMRHIIRYRKITIFFARTCDTLTNY